MQTIVTSDSTSHFDTWLEMHHHDQILENARKTLVSWDAVLDVDSIGGSLYKVSKYHVVNQQ